MVGLREVGVGCVVERRSFQGVGGKTKRWIDIEDLNRALAVCLSRPRVSMLVIDHYESKMQKISELI
jgi:hypothetical protein